MPKVYAARKECGHIVAAFPISLDSKAKAEIARQLIAAGVDITQVDENEVGLWFALSCDCHNPQPSLLTYADHLLDAQRLMKEAGELPTVSMLQRRLRITFTQAVNLYEKLRDDFVAQEIQPEEPKAEEAPLEEAKAEEAPAEEAPAVDHQAEADSLLDNFLSKKDEEEPGEEDKGGEE